MERLDQWDQMIEIRGEVLKILEVARKDKFIGNSLEAKVKIEARGEALELLKTSKSFLPSLFIVSQVEILENLEAGRYFYQTDGLKILVMKADGEKCERCWTYSPNIGEDPRFETVCPKCSAALREMGFDPNSLGSAGVA